MVAACSYKALSLPSCKAFDTGFVRFLQQVIGVDSRDSFSADIIHYMLWMLQQDGRSHQDVNLIASHVSERCGEHLHDSTPSMFLDRSAFFKVHWS